MLLARTPASVTLLLTCLLCYPATVISQTYVKVAICTFCSAAFIALGCPTDYDSLMCRLQAFKLNVLNCRTYPCVNYDAPEQNICVESPLDCPIQYIRLFGLCSPLEMCCGTGGTVESSRAGQWKSWQKLVKQGRYKRSLKDLHHLNKPDFSTAKELEKRAASTLVASKKTENEIAAALSDDVKTEFDARLEQMGFDRIDSATVKEYVHNFPENLDDPVVAEQTIKDEYYKFKQDIATINQEEALNGSPGLITPRFEHFRAVALGERPIKS